MARRSPAVERCVAVLNHLASSPTEQFTLSELARELDLNKATAHALLATLADEGWVIRNPDSLAYCLGPALIAVGAAARQTYPAARLAERPMAELSEEFDLQCLASQALVRDDGVDEIVILAATGSRRPLGIDIQPGQRMPLRPPLGSVFVAWAGAEEIDRWLGNLGPKATKADFARYREALEVVRERGYSVGLGGDEQQRMVEQLGRGESGNGAPAGAEEYALTELADEAAYRVNHIGAPVFDARGRVTLALFLIGFQGQIPAREVPAYAKRLVEAAGEVTDALHGRAPIG